MRRFICSDPDHVGDRARILPRDQFTERREYVRADQNERLHTRTIRDICRACVERIKNPNRPEAML